jgi:mannose-6-phosphate isomerase-like protein (cupin superfamily)
MKYPIAGTTIACTTSPLTIYDQLGGGGIVHNMVLAVPGHLNGAGREKRWASVEYVCVDPVHDGRRSSVGLHTQGTDEVYIGLAGRGELVTNGTPSAFSAGTLAIAPRGTSHTISNPSLLDALEFLVVEVEAPAASAGREPAFLDLFALMKATGSFYPVTLAGHPVRPRVATVDLAAYMAGPWGVLSLVELPAGAAVGEYLEPACDQLLFVMGGMASITLTASRKTAAEPEDEDRAVRRVFSREPGPQSVAIPAGVPRCIENCTPGLNSPLTLLCLNVRRDPSSGSGAAYELAEARA